ncbi:MAG TPA: trypsin-like peptidase domain-containing protein, partial [Thermoanaerobaculia bacterium]|nr:trypsin-like peptidase domain-containing protein [Thermoanaerobaculia bacterium]
AAAPLREVFRRVRPAVVVIATRQKELAPDRRAGFVSMQGLGSGVVISEAGLVLTAAHVVQTADQIVVGVSESVTVPAYVVASSLAADVALLQLEKVPDGLVVARLGDSDRLQVGDPVFVVGHPFGLDHTLTTGVLSARRRPKQMTDTLMLREIFQTDAAVNQGNSGGPMFNAQGEVVGIVSSILSHSGGFEGLGFATPSNVARQLLLDQKAVWTGVDGYLVDGDIARALNVPQPAGFLVERVAAGSPAARLGLLPGSLRVTIEGETVLLGGDVVLEVAGIAITDEAALEKARIALGRLAPGDLLAVKVLRGGKVVELSTRVPPPGRP